MHDIKIPKMGQSTVEVDLAKWLVKAGDRVEKGTVLAEVESEKVTLEIESDVAGVVDALLVGENEATEVGVVICRIQPD
ncbi:MAG: biotin/lipoyl-binding protein [Burkholderiales bacterium]|nr:MAG: biotin/lipoyl-binding protein [Burkholderiales bacterium]